MTALLPRRTLAGVDTPACVCGGGHYGLLPRVVFWSTRGVMEPPSSGVKAVVARASRRFGWGDQLEAILERAG